MTLVITLLATAFAGIVSMLLAALLLFYDDKLKKLSIALVAFAAGAMLGAVFFDILPEISVEGAIPFAYVLAGISVFYVLEQVLSWHHHRYGTSDTHPYVYLIMAGDTVHNFVDGAAIAVSFLISVPLGVVTTLAVFFHEIPQEIGDFSVLISAGFSRTKALLWNGASAVIALLGAAMTWFLSSQITQLSVPLLAFAAGNFIYIAAADLMPITHREKFELKAIGEIAALFAGIGMIALVGFLIG